MAHHGHFVLTEGLFNLFTFPLDHEGCTNAQCLLASQASREVTLGSLGYLLIILILMVMPVGVWELSGVQVCRFAFGEPTTSPGLQLHHLLHRLPVKGLTTGTMSSAPRNMQTLMTSTSDSFAVHRLMANLADRLPDLFHGLNVRNPVNAHSLFHEQDQ